MTYGALAQLVARYIRIVEVTGSNPVCSTIKSFSKEKDFCIMFKMQFEIQIVCTNQC